MKQEKQVFHLSVRLFGVYACMGVAPKKRFFKQGKKEKEK